MAVSPRESTQEATFKNIYPDAYYGIKSILRTLK